MSVSGLAGPGALPVGPGPGRRPDGGPDARPGRLPGRGPAGRPQHLRVVDNHAFGDARRRRLIRLGGAVMGGAVVALLFVSVGMHVMLAQNQFRLDRLNAQAAAEQDQYQKLRLDVDRLEAPQRIIATAQGKLGMVQPGSVTYLAPSAATAATGAAAPTPTSGPTGSGWAGGASPAPRSSIGPATLPPGWSALKPQLAAHS